MKPGFIGHFKIAKRVKQTAIEEEPNLETSLQTMQENLHGLEEKVTPHENKEENYQTPEQMKEDFISNVDHLNTGTPSQESPFTIKHLQPISLAFASAIVWPSKSPIKGNQKRRKKVRLPDAVNSREWIQYWNEKENIRKKTRGKQSS